MERLFGEHKGELVPLRWFVLATLVALFAGVALAQAQHPSDVQKLTADGRYYDALLAFERMPKRISTTDSTIAAAKSAWALSLTGMARLNYDTALRDERLSAVEKARIVLGKGLIEFQDERYQVAALYAEKVAATLPEASPLRGNGWLLWGESLSRMKLYGQAEEKYSKALEEVDSDIVPEVHFLLGEARIRLGKYSDAKADYEAVPLRSDRGPIAIRRLASIALEQGHTSHAAFWLAKGREEFPDSFVDSWVDYAEVEAAIQKGDHDRIREVRAEALKKFPPSDPWLILLCASAEAFEWKRAIKEAGSDAGK
jgi:tetratricopeptide (TPR) repeat protein